MTKSEFIRKVATKAHVSPKVAKLWVTLVFDVLTEQIMEQERVNFANFGTFKRRLKLPKKRLDVKSGQIVTDPAKTLVSFYPSRILTKTIATKAPLEEEA